MNCNPLISVLMPVYNGEKYLREAIDSVLAQTYKNFELIIVNDASTDGTEQIVQSYHSEQIHYFRNETNRGIVFSRNFLIEQARGDFFAVIDSDDLWVPDKLERQHVYMMQHPECYLCGTWAKIIDGKNMVVSRIQHPIHYNHIKANLLFQSSFVHSSVLIRKMNDHTFHYDSFYPVCEDYDLWFRICQKYPAHNIGEYLTLYRIHKTNISKEKEILLSDKRREIINQACLELGSFSDKEINIIDSIGNLTELPMDSSLVNEWKTIVDKLISYNQEKKFVAQKDLVSFLLYRWAFYNAATKHYRYVPKMFLYKTNVSVLCKSINLILLKIFIK